MSGPLDSADSMKRPRHRILRNDEMPDELASANAPHTCEPTIQSRESGQTEAHPLAVSDPASIRSRRLTPIILVCTTVGLVGLGYGAYQVWPQIVHGGGPITLARHVPGGGAVRIEVAQWKTALLMSEGTHFDFGEVKQGEKLSHTFQVTNVGTRDLPIHQLRMNCACNAQVQYDRDVCSPGESCGIQLAMTAVGYGQPVKTIPFALVEHGNTETLFKLTFAYRVASMQQVQFVPEWLDLGQLACTGSEATRELQLVLVGPPDKPEPELLELTSDSPAIRVAEERREIPAVDARTAKTIPAQRVIYWLQIQVRPRDLELGQLHGHITARTSIGETKLHLKGEICRPVLATPASLLIERFRPGTTVYHIRLRNVAEEPTQILGAKATANGVSCQIDSNRSDVAVQVQADAELNGKPAVEIQVQAGDTLETVRVPLVLF